MQLYVTKQYELIHNDIVLLAALKGVKPAELIVDILTKEVRSALKEELEAVTLALDLRENKERSKRKENGRS